MVNFKEIPKRTIEAVVRFTNEQRAERARRLSDPTLQASLERTTNLLFDDLKHAGSRAVEAVYRVTLGAPLSSIWEGTKEFGRVIAHNFSVRNPKRKKRIFKRLISLSVLSVFIKKAH